MSKHFKFSFNNFNKYILTKTNDVFSVEFNISFISFFFNLDLYLSIISFIKLDNLLISKIDKSLFLKPKISSSFL